MSDEHILMDGDLTKQFLAITKPTMDRIFAECEKQKVKKCYAISLYNIYCYTAKWQKTNRPKCTTSYAAKATDISEAMVRKCKSILLSIGLIEDVQAVDKSNRIVGHYIRVKYYVSAPKCEIHPREKPQGGKTHTVENQETNSYSNNKENSYSNNKEIPPKSPKGEKSDDLLPDRQEGKPSDAKTQKDKSAVQLRAGRLMRYTERRTWDVAETRAWNKAKQLVEETPEEEWSLLEDFYGLGKEFNGELTYKRTGLKTLLENWNTEITRARNWFDNHPRPRSNEEVARIEKSEADTTPVAMENPNEGRWSDPNDIALKTEITEDTF